MGRTEEEEVGEDVYGLEKNTIGPGIGHGWWFFADGATRTMGGGGGKLAGVVEQARLRGYK